MAGLVAWGGGDFWLIDEVQAGGQVATGYVWKFTVPAFLIVDDSDQYDDVGNRQSTTAGGHGVFFVDDIHLIKE